MLNKPMILDLRGYLSYAMPEKIAHGRGQTMAKDLMGQARYTVYTEAAEAIAEVTYSRLCNVIGLSCVQSEYATGLDGVKPNIVSASEYDDSWMPAPTSVVSLGSRQANNDAIKNYGLSMLLFNPFTNKKPGYIKGDKSFVKANNGQCFYSFELKKILEGTDKEYKSPYSPMSVDVYFQISSMFPQIKEIIPRIESLTDEQIEWCASTPGDLYGGKIGSEFVSLRLHLLRDFAKKATRSMHDE
ncbi:MAG: hypothetical protein ACK5QX_06505 [bacterium]